MTPELRARTFWLRARPDHNGCWRWQGRHDSHGYGSLRIAGKEIRAHRFAYELVVGPFPEGLVTDHLCRVRDCVNPDHLEAVTNVENIRRGDAGKALKPHTYCHKGHLLAETGVPVKNGRLCRVCNREYHRRYKAMRRARKLAA